LIEFGAGFLGGDFARHGEGFGSGRFADGPFLKLRSVHCGVKREGATDLGRPQ
jgi:hypothetical protein